jgi:hypothetical protein
MKRKVYCFSSIYILDMRKFDEFEIFVYVSLSMSLIAKVSTRG